MSQDGKSKKSSDAGSSRTRSGGLSSAARTAAKVLAVLAITAAVAVGSMVGMKALDRRVQTLPVQTEPIEYSFRLADRASWMPSSLVRSICRSIIPPGVAFNDPTLTQKIYDAAIANPWIARVEQVEKSRTADGLKGLVELHAEYRRPFAMVGQNGQYYFVDFEGYRLSEEFIPRWYTYVRSEASTQPRQVQFVTREEIPPGVTACLIPYVIIDGVQAPPPAPGKRWGAVEQTAATRPASRASWMGGWKTFQTAILRYTPPVDHAADLMEGLQVIRAISGRKWASQISTIDVRNYGGRSNRGRCHIALIATNDKSEKTEIRFGRFAQPGDYEIPTEVKLSNLEKYAAEHYGRLAGYNSYIDLRYGQCLVSFN